MYLTFPTTHFSGYGVTLFSVEYKIFTALVREVEIYLHSSVCVFGVID